MATWYEDVLKFLQGHVYVAVIAGMVLALIAVIIIWRCCCRRPQNTYTIIQSPNDKQPLNAKPRVYGTNEASSRDVEKALNERGGSGDRQAALMRCRYWIRENQNFRILKHLDTIGQNVSKDWFVIKPTRNLDQMMTMIEPSRHSLIPLTPDMNHTLQGLITLLQHPYIMPINTFSMLKEQNQLVIMQDLCVKGSVKDLIHETNPISTYDAKYIQKARPLPLKKILVISKNVLEGLAFLKKRKFAYRALHTGNVLVDGSFFRLSGLETTLFGHEIKDHALVVKALQKINGSQSPGELTWDYDVICFGRFLFEMALGHELRKSVPDPEQLTGKCEYALIELLVVIFFHPDKRVPTVEELLDQPMFVNVRCAALEKYIPAPMINSKEIKQILKAATKKRTLIKQPRRKLSSKTVSGVSAPPTPSTSNPVFSTTVTTPPPPPPPATTLHQDGAIPPPPLSTVDYYASPTTSTFTSPQSSYPPTPRSHSPVAVAPTPTPSSPPPTSSSGRSGLLQSIALGTKLKKTSDADRSKHF